MSSGSVLDPRGFKSLHRCTSAHRVLRSHGSASTPCTEHRRKPLLFCRAAKDRQKTTVKHLKLEVFHYVLLFAIAFEKREHCYCLGLDSQKEKKTDIVAIIVNRHLQRNRGEKAKNMTKGS